MQLYFLTLSIVMLFGEIVFTHTANRLQIIQNRAAPKNLWSSVGHLKYYCSWSIQLEAPFTQASVLHFNNFLVFQ